MQNKYKNNEIISQICVIKNVFAKLNKIMVLLLPLLDDRGFNPGSLTPESVAHPCLPLGKLNHAHPL